MYEQIRHMLRRYQAVLAGLPESPRRSIREHQEILTAIRAGDQSLAERTAKAHIAALVHRYQDASNRLGVADGAREAA